jgi:hypothetical protein
MRQALKITVISKISNPLCHNKGIPYDKNRGGLDRLIYT